MNIVHTAIPGVEIVETAPFIDHRGAFFRLFCAQELSEILGERHIAQINYSRTETVGAIRGLHYQHPPCADTISIHPAPKSNWSVACLAAYSTWRSI